MGIEVIPVRDESTFAEVVDVEFEASSKPWNSFWEVLKGPGPSECAARQWKWQLLDKEAYWLAAKDTETGKIIGAAQWRVHRTNPYAQPRPPFKVTWWPEGSVRQTIAQEAFDDFFSHRPSRMNRPHAMIPYCFVHSQERRRGAGKALMEWGCQFVDDAELEAFVEATSSGKPLYESVGFVVVDHYYLDPQMESPSEEYAQVKKEIFPEPFIIYFMWRPKGGKFEPGKTRYSWEEDGSAEAVA